MPQRMQRREWQILDRDWDRIRHYIDLAPGFGINAIQFGEQIAHGAADVLAEPEMAAHLREALAHCREHGLRTYQWIHELARIPDEVLRQGGRVNLRSDAPVWEFVRARYQRYCEALPELDGVVLTCSETQAPVYGRDALSDLSPSRRIAHLVEILARESARQGKELVVRSFAHTRTREDWMQQALDAVSEPITVMMKCVPVDWHPFMPLNPSICKVRNHPVLVEMDHGQEFVGQAIVPYPDVGYTHEVMSALSQVERVEGFVTRIHRYRNHAYGTPNWVSVAAFSRMLDDPAQDAPGLWPAAAGDVYGPEAGARLVPVLHGFERVMRKLYYFRGFWGLNHSRIPTPNFLYTAIAFWNHVKHFEDPAERQRLAALSERLRRPDAEVVAMVIAEKDEALNEVAALRRQLDELQPHLPIPVRFEISRAFEHLEVMSAILRPFTESYFATLACLLRPDEVMRRQAAAAIAALEAQATKHAALLVRQTYELKPRTQLQYAEDAITELRELLDGRRQISNMNLSENEYWKGEP